MPALLLLLPKQKAKDWFFGSAVGKRCCLVVAIAQATDSMSGVAAK
jgi:hypothetical protein